MTVVQHESVKGRTTYIQDIAECCCTTVAVIRVIMRSYVRD